MGKQEKLIEWWGDSYETLLTFPEEVLKDIGYQLHLVQNGAMPTNWKSMKEVGAGAYEIRVRTGNNQYRTICVAKYEDKVHVLHAFMKKTRQTPSSDIAAAKIRYSQLVSEKRRKKKPVIIK